MSFRFYLKKKALLSLKQIKTPSRREFKLKTPKKSQKNSKSLNLLH